MRQVSSRRDIIQTRFNDHDNEDMAHRRLFLNKDQRASWLTKCNPQNSKFSNRQSKE